MDNIFFQISLLLAVTVGVSFIVRFLRQPLIVAYIFAGVVCGPFILNLLRGDQHLYEAFAQFGVVLLLFIIGLNLNFNHLKSIGRVSLITGLGQVTFTAALGFFLLLALGLKAAPALYLAMAITFSSTIVIMKLLSDKKDTDTVYGRYTIGLMLVQDVIAVVLVVALGMAGGGGGGDAVGLVVRLAAVSALLVLASRYLMPRLLARIADSSELLFLFSIAWCFGVASLLYALGFSLEIGAVMSGIALSSSPFQMEIASRLRPLRDFFLVLFFIVLGSEMGFGSAGHIFLPAAALSAFILIGNPLILYVLFRFLKFTRRNSLLAGLTAAQVSEFGFVLLFAGRQAGHLQGDEVAIFTVVAITTIFFSSYLISYNEQVYRALLPLFRLFGPDRHRQEERPPEKYDAWVVGHHRIGRKVAEALAALKRRFAVIDFDPTVATRLQDSATPFFFGDIADVEFLDGLPIANSQLVVMTIPSVDDQINLMRHVRKAGGAALIIANAYHQSDVAALYEGGADFVMMPHLLGGHWIASVLRHKRWDKETLAELKLEQDSMLGA